MSSLTWLTYSVVLTGVLWVPYILDRLATVGITEGMKSPDFKTGGLHHAWGDRLRAAHANAVENLVVFAPLVLIAAHLGVADSALLLLATQIYFFARLAHAIVYAAGIPVARTLAFSAGFAAQIMVAVEICKALG